MTKKILIINGSLNKHGNVAYILNLLNENLNDVLIEEINPYYDNIKPCLDCKYCWKIKGCVIEDSMAQIWADDYQIVILASPVYYSNLTPPMLNILSRFNMLYCNKHFLNIEHDFKEKQGFLLLCGGGNGSPRYAIEMARLIFKYLNADFDLENNYICSLNTDNIPVNQDEYLSKEVRTLIKKINHK